MPTAYLRFEAAHPVVAWLCWVPNLLLAEALFNCRPVPAGRAA